MLGNNSSKEGKYKSIQFHSTNVKNILVLIILPGNNCILDVVIEKACSKRLESNVATSHDFK